MKIKTSTRVVFLFKNFVIKIPIDYRGYLQGKNERQIWDNYKQLGKLCPMIWEIFGIVCQSRCIPIDKINANKVKEIKQLIPTFDFDNCDLYNPDNWGTYNKKEVLLDYGVNEQISKMYFLRKL